MAAGAQARVRQAVLLGLGANITLALVKLVAGVVGHSYALIADAAESAFDLFGTVAVWAGVRMADRDATEAFPFGFGKAEAVSGATVAILLLLASVGIALSAVHEIRTPHFSPAPWTLVVLAVVIVVKELVARRVRGVAQAEGSRALVADAEHHRGDVLTSLAAFVGILVAVMAGPGWESADDWAALLAAGVIAWNGVRLLRGALGDLMDKAAPPALVAQVRAATLAVPDVRGVDKLVMRSSGRGFWVDIHVEADAAMSLHEAHIVSGKVKGAIRAAVPQVRGVLVHMEPHEPTVVPT